MHTRSIGVGDIGARGRSTGVSLSSVRFKLGKLKLRIAIATIGNRTVGFVDCAEWDSTVMIMCCPCPCQRPVNRSPLTANVNGQWSK